MSPESVKAAVHHGHVTSTGRAAWLCPKELAERCATHIRGVRHVIDRIDVEAQSAELDIRRQIVDALRRSAEVDATHIEVAAADGVVRLSGRVDTWAQRSVAARAGAAAPGVIMVDNPLIVEPEFMLPPL